MLKTGPLVRDELALKGIFKSTI